MALGVGKKLLYEVLMLNPVASTGNFMITTGIIITVNLVGQIKPSVKSEIETKFTDEEGKLVSIHKNAEISKCTRKIRISKSTVISWQEDTKNVPNGISETRWKKLLSSDRFRYIINSYDEGYGVSYEQV